MDARGIKKIIKEVIFPGDLAKIGIFFCQGDKMTRRMILVPSFAAGKRKMLSAARLESPMVTKTTSSKPAGSIFKARAATRTSNGPNCSDKSSQRRLLFRDSVWYCSAGDREASLAQSRASALLAEGFWNSHR